VLKGTWGFKLINLQFENEPELVDLEISLKPGERVIKKMEKIKQNDKAS